MSLSKYSVAKYKTKIEFFNGKKISNFLFIEQLHKKFFYEPFKPTIYHFFFQNINNLYRKIQLEELNNE